MAKLVSQVKTEVVHTVQLNDKEVRALRKLLGEADGGNETYYSLFRFFKYDILKEDM